LRALNNAARRSRLLRGDESLRLALWVKIDEKKGDHPIRNLGKMYDAMMLFKPFSIEYYKDSHQFSCKIQVYNSNPIPKKK
jgi:hypothetical protein